MNLERSLKTENSSKRRRITKKARVNPQQLRSIEKLGREFGLTWACTTSSTPLKSLMGPGKFRSFSYAQILTLIQASKAILI
jgi:hypothetical protein